VWCIESERHIGVTLYKNGVENSGTLTFPPTVYVISSSVGCFGILETYWLIYILIVVCFYVSSSVSYAFETNTYI
jgi:hypothetical protein